MVYEVNLYFLVIPMTSRDNFNRKWPSLVMPPRGIVETDKTSQEEYAPSKTPKNSTDSSSKAHEVAAWSKKEKKES